MFAKKSDNGIDADSQPQQSPQAEPQQIIRQESSQQIVSRTADGSIGSIIGSDLKIRGQQISIESSGLLTVDGEMDADLFCKQLVVGEQAQITGTVAADNVAVFGSVNGTIKGLSVNLHSTANVDGDIFHEELAVEAGAVFNGQCSKLPDENTQN